MPKIKWAKVLFHFTLAFFAAHLIYWFLLDDPRSAYREQKQLQKYNKEKT